MTPAKKWGTEASDMPDDCHDHCVKLGFDAVYFPYRWVEGMASYRCKRGHYWTCGWGHRESGSAPQNEGQPHFEVETPR